MRAERRNRRGTRRSGATAVETALVLPVFLLVILTVIEMSQLGMAYQVMSAAAREGSRVAILGERSQADVRAAVETRLRGSGIKVDAVTLTPANWATAPKGTPITVSLAVPFGRISWMSEALFLGGATVHASATLGSERP